MRGIHRWPVNSPHEGPVTRKIIPIDDDIMIFFIEYSNSICWRRHISCFRHSSQQPHKICMCLLTIDWSVYISVFYRLGPVFYAPPNDKILSPLWISYTWHLSQTPTFGYPIQKLMMSIWPLSFQHSAKTIIHKTHAKTILLPFNCTTARNNVELEPTVRP